MLHVDLGGTQVIHKSNRGIIYSDSVSGSGGV